MVREVEHLPDVPKDDQGHADAVVSVIGQLAAYDHWRQRVVLIENVVAPEAATDDELDALYAAAVARLDELAADGARPLDELLVEPPPGDDELPAVHSTMGSDLYARAVEVAREHILAGDIFQVVLAQRFDFDLDAEPFDLYRVLRQVNPSPYMYYVRQPGLTLVGASPEPMVRVTDGRVVSRPIAGTRRRGATDEEDARLAGELREHPKEIAEHVMLVDLARNDVGRVVRFGTEQVEEYLTLERYSHVMHLTSQVAGDLAEGRTAIDVLRATLPAGTVSGAPKVRAMEIIDDLEPTKRGPYAGVVGYLDFSGNVDTAIAIRTMVVDDEGRASVQAGAGIVADSVPEHEDLECRNKARALLAAVPAARRMTAARQRGPAAESASPLGVGPVGLLEGLAVVGGGDPVGEVDQLGDDEAAPGERRAVEGRVHLVGEGGDDAADDPLLLHRQVAAVAVGDGAQPVGQGLDLLGHGVAGDEPVEAVGHRQAAQLAGGALPARLDGEEPRHHLRHLEHRRGVVEDPEPGGAHARPDRLEPLVAEPARRAGRR